MRPRYRRRNIKKLSSLRNLEKFPEARTLPRLGPLTAAFRRIPVSVIDRSMLGKYLSFLCLFVNFSTFCFLRKHVREMMRRSANQPLCSRLLRNFLNIEHSSSAGSTLPLYLCPAAARLSSTLSSRSSRRPIPAAQESRLLPLHQTRKSHAEANEIRDDAALNSTVVSLEQRVLVPAGPAPVRQLPVQCHGCGALSQTTVADTAGYYDLSRKPVKIFLGLLKEEEPRRQSEDDIVQASLRNLSQDQLKELGINPEAVAPNETQKDGRPQSPPKDPEVPLCDRCHKLVYHHTGTPIYHPTIEAIRDTLSESPYKYNHVYHILDAADFPMSLLPKVNQLLDLMPLRTKNRRQRHGSTGKFFHGKRTEMSFIITRSDLLAPKKEAVDRMMPYLQETLRDALPRDSRHVRLGNVRCVSAKRSWWTKELKEDIWHRGGAGWMVGKVNVGKSQLFNEVFPKGRMDWKESKESRQDISISMQHKDYDQEREAPTSVLQELDDLDEDSLLPPAQEEKNYPQMPVVSALPGTTASPIRVPFGGGKGELIDLPGLARSNLENLIREEHRPSLVMKSRITPEQHVIKPGRSLLIGGFIRITPRTEDLIFLGYNFTPLQEHMCGTEKAIEIQTQTGVVNVENIAVPETASTIKLAGSFPLKFDVTKRRAGPITRKDAVGIKVENLPYRVLSLDILIEGCGWVEITAQVRARELYKPMPKPAPSIGSGEEEVETLETMGLSGSSKGARARKRFNSAGEEILQSLDLSEPGSRPKPGSRDRPRENPRERGRLVPEPQRQEEEQLNWPVVDVYSPEGRFVGSRRPMNAWLLNKIRKTPQTSKQRPRKSMVGAKKREKQAKRGW